MNPSAYPWAITCRAAFLTLLACGGSPATNGTESGDTTAGTQADTGTTTTTTTAPTTGATSDATTGSTMAPTTGSTMAPTTGGPDEAMFCEERCTDDADCKIGGNDNTGYTCKDNRCVTDPCVTALDCLFSGFSTEVKCTTQADCASGVCVDAGDGVGRCATSSERLPCDILPAEEAMYPPIEGGAAVSVCVFTEYVCKNGTCFNPCESDDECYFKHEPICDVNTGLCVCSSDADCQAEPDFHVPICIDGQCGCASDADCVGDSVDRCYEGTCGCSSSAACTDFKLHDGTTKVCE